MITDVISILASFVINCKYTNKFVINGLKGSPDE